MKCSEVEQWKSVSVSFQYVVPKAFATLPLTEIAGSHTVVHPWTVMIHPTDAPVTNATVMRVGWLVGLTMTAHGMRGDPLLEQNGPRHGFFGNTAGIGKHCLDVRCQCQGANGPVYHGHTVG